MTVDKPTVTFESFYHAELPLQRADACTREEVVSIKKGGGAVAMTR